MNTKTRILFYGDFVAATGFSTVSRNILEPLADSEKYEIEVLGINYWGDPDPLQEKFRIWPVGVNPQRDPYGRQYVQERIKSTDFDILFMIQDSFILDFIGDLLPELRSMGKKFKSMVYFPVDGVPKKRWIDAMSVADYPVTYTQFGYNECVKVCPTMEDKLRVIPHGINPTDFFPLSYREAFEFKSAYFGPLSDRFIVTYVGRNQQRKDFPRMMMAFKEFNDKHPNSVLYCHCAIKDQGWDLAQVSESVGLSINRNLVFPYNFGPNRGFPRHILNRIYNASDVIVSSNLGEGWGLSSVEAMATKTPIIIPDNTSASEIVGEDRGILVRSGHDLEHFTVLPNDNEVKRPIMHIGDMVEALGKLYEDEALRMKFGEAGYKWVKENLVWDKHIVPQWETILEEALEALKSDENGSCLAEAYEV